jgi:hypothetical protein
MRGTVTTTSSRQFVLAGWVKTSHGRVKTEITQKIDFSNAQQFVAPPPSAVPQTFVQNIAQSTSISSTTRVRGGEDGRESTLRMSWPLAVDLTVNIAADGGFSQVGKVTQAYNRVDSDGESSGLISNSGQWANTYPTTVGQAGAQRYFSSDSDGHCYSRSLTAASGILTAIVDGKGCDE